MSDDKIHRLELDIASLQAKMNALDRVLKATPGLLTVTNKLRFRSGDDMLDIGMVSDGELLVRDGTDVVGWGGIVPACRVFNNINISVPNSTLTVLTFNSDLLDTDNIHSSAGRLTCRTAGVYMIYACIEFAGHATGERHCAIRLNGGGSCVADIKGNLGSGNAVRIPLSTSYPLEIDDYLEVVVYQNRGGSLDVVRGNDYSQVFGMTYLGKV